MMMAQPPPFLLSLRFAVYTWKLSIISWLSSRSWSFSQVSVRKQNSTFSVVKKLDNNSILLFTEHMLVSEPLRVVNFWLGVWPRILKVSLPEFLFLVSFNAFWTFRKGPFNVVDKLFIVFVAPPIQQNQIHRQSVLQYGQQFEGHPS